MPLADQTLNRLKVLKAIRRRGPLSRGELIALTGLAGSSITLMTGDLLRRGLIVERREQGAPRPGRPRTELEIRSDAALVIGARLSGRGTMRAAFVDLAGNERHADRFPVRHGQSMDGFAAAIADGLDAVIARSGYDRRAIGRVGLALPAVVDNRTGMLHFVTGTAPGAVPMADVVSARLGLATSVENDLVWMARAEHWFGRAQHLDSFGLVLVGDTITSAAYADGLPRFGENGFSSELGHVKMILGPEAPACFCGAHGCLAAIASIYGMTRSGRARQDPATLGAGAMNADFEALLDRADAGDAAAVAIVERAGLYLGVAIANHVSMADPGTVLILASSERLCRRLAGPVARAVADHVFPAALAATRLIFGAVDPAWRSKGAAALALEMVYLDDRAQGDDAPHRRVRRPPIGVAGG